MPDPKLKAAMEEIKTVLKKHDIGGVVVLGSPTHSEFLREYCPSWTCMTYEEQGNEKRLRFRALKKDYPTKEEWKQRITDSMGLLLGFVHVLEQETKMLDHVIRQIAPHFESIEHMDRYEGPTDGLEGG